MARFRRRRAEDADPDDTTLDGAQSDGAQSDDAHSDDAQSDLPGLGDAEADGAPGFDRGAGPFDESEIERSDQELTRIDLGALRVPGIPGVGVQVEAEQATATVRVITGIVDQAAVQLSVFAAPRRDGLWEEVRGEITTELTSTAGASIQQVDGPFGIELRGNIPARSADGKTVIQPVRFTGIDGPRWFLRAVFLGRAAVEVDGEDDLHRFVRETIVVRGSDAMAPGDPLPLRLPPEDSDAASESPDADLDPFERGPEITEVR